MKRSYTHIYILCWSHSSSTINYTRTPQSLFTFRRARAYTHANVHKRILYMYIFFYQFRNAHTHTRTYTRTHTHNTRRLDSSSSGHGRFFIFNDACPCGIPAEYIYMHTLRATDVVYNIGSYRNIIIIRT